MDLYWRESLIVPTEAEYIEMVNNSELSTFIQSGSLTDQALMI